MGFLAEYSKNDKEFADSVWEKLTVKLSIVAKRSYNKLPYTSNDGVHDDYTLKDINWWTNGFWPGLMWIMYNGTKNDVYKETAINGEKLLDEALKNHDELHHDVGFMWFISSGASFAITGNKDSYTRTIYAADVLAARYNVDGGYIRAWNDGNGDADNKGWAIIDCMMNIPLLYWASEQTGDKRYKSIAMKHADKTMKYHVRPDGSVKHIVSYNFENGEYIENLKGQGYDVDSSWSRGQAWALYGFALSYLYTGKKEYLDTAKRVAHYFIANVCDDYKPLADFRAPEEPVMYDTTAGAIAASGLLQIADLVPEFEGKMYYNASIKLLKTMDKEFCDYNDKTDSVLQYGTERWLKEGEKGKGVHIPIIYGDYYYAEAINRLRGNTIDYIKDN